MTFTDNHAKILTRLADGCFHSGSELSVELGLSRSAIWKYLHQFSHFGLEFTAISGKGYRLNRKIELFSIEMIRKNLHSTTQSLLLTLDVFMQISSTNDYLLSLMKTKPRSGYVCLAESQIKGRGRRGREWVSPFGENIYLSLSWVFDNGFSSLTGLSLAMGIAVVRALNELGVHEIGLKWPNDIYWKNKKLGGILIEVSGESSAECHAVIGLGLNLDLTEKKARTIAQPWVSLNHINPSFSFSRHQLVTRLLNHLIAVIASFEAKTFKVYAQEWQQYDCMFKREVSIYRGQQQFNGTVVGINDQGMLCLEDNSGTHHTFASGEVSFREI